MNWLNGLRILNRRDSKEPLVLQQIGLLIALLPEICRLQQQIATWRNDSPVAQAAH
jgi:hypothetical protein